MQLDLQKIFSTYQEPLQWTVSVDLSGEDLPGCSVAQPVKTVLSARKQGNVLMFSLEMDPELEFSCARCLKETRRIFPVRACYEVRKGDWEDPDTELPFTPQGLLEIQQLCYAELVLQLPMVLLCSKDCVGLCPVCGHRKPCACTQETSGAANSGLAILKQLLTE